MKKIISFLIVVLALSLNVTNLVDAQKKLTLSEEIDMLNQRAKELIDRENALKAAGAKIVQKGDDLIWVEKKLNKSVSDYGKRLNDHKALTIVHDKQLQALRNECANVDYDAWVGRGCQQKKDTYNRQVDEANKVKYALDEEVKQLRVIDQRLKQDKQNWQEKKRELEENYIKLERDVNAWGEWFTRLTNWPTFEDLKARERLAKICKTLTPEAAAACLHRVWDGAQKRGLLGDKKPGKSFFGIKPNP